MSFQVETTTKTLFRSINVLGENHGKEIHPGIALAFEFVIGNNWLDTLARGLKGTLYSKKPPEGQQLELEVVSDMPHVRYPELSQLPWDKEYTGVTLFIEHGTTGDNIWVRDCKVSSLALTLMEGGSVKVKGSATSSNPDEHERGRITSKIKQEAMCRFLPPKLGETKAPTGETKAQLSAEAAWPFPTGDKAPDTFRDANGGAPPKHLAEEPDPSIMKGAKAFEKAVKAKLPAKAAAPAAKKAATKPPIKYRDAATGETWSGRGLQPKWLKAALAKGKTLEELAL